VLVTGATGFVGHHLAARLLREGHDVHVVVRPQSQLGRLGSLRERLHLHVHDGTTRGLIAVMEAARPEVVFHLASRFLATHQSDDVQGLIEDNLLFPTQLVEAAVRSGVLRLVNTGTSWQHFESRPYDPVCLYAASKEAFEKLLAHYVNASALRVVTLKLFDTYGPGDPRPKLFALLRRTARTGEQLEMSPGAQVIDLCHVDDVVEAFVVAGQRLRAPGEPGMESFAVSGERHTLRDLVEIFNQVSPRPARIVWGGRPYREREVMQPWSTGTALPGWRPKVDLRSGMARLLADPDPAVSEK
jgi:nucleoside-diphosphate-sugar epimerase